MNKKTITKKFSYQINAFVQRLNAIAWPIKCYWAKYFPIEVIVDDDVGVAAMDYERILIHPKVEQFSENVLFTILAHEWAHRMASPKSITAKQRIIDAVATDLKINIEVARLISAPAIELIVDRTNCDVESWSEVYQEGFTDSFNIFLKELETESIAASDVDNGKLDFQKMQFALRLANVSLNKLPSYIRHHEVQARILIDELFKDWQGHSERDDPDHIRKIIRFSRAYYEWLPAELLQQPELLKNLLGQFGDLITMLTELIDTSKNNSISRHSSSGRHKVNTNQHGKAIFDMRLTRQVTDHLLNMAHKPRQITGLWQSGHSFSKLDLKRSFRCSPVLISGLTTRRKTESSRIHNFEKGKKSRVCLIIDDSGSMVGDGAKFSRSISEGINRFASQKDVHIGLITFGSEIDVSFMPDRKYQQVSKALSTLDGNLGGTNLLPALKQVIQFIESDREMTHVILMTDACISDWINSQKLITEILQHLSMTVLMINSDIPEEINKVINESNHSMHFLKVDPTTSTQLSILEEIIR